MSDRADFTTGLRQLADWLDANPQVRQPGSERLLISLSTNPAVEEFAAQHGLQTTADDEGNLSADLTFGPITYHAYGYVDFDAHCARNDERRARSWAAEQGLTLTPQTS
jgi:hypothetical protein